MLRENIDFTAQLDEDQILYQASGLNVKSKLDDRIVLHSFDAVIYEGQWITLIGKNGSGKSTLASLIAGNQLHLYDINGQENRDRLKDIPIITQMTSQYLIGSTPFEDLMISSEQFGSLDTHFEEQILALAKELHFDHVLYAPIDTLSGGEKQLVAVAGSLLMNKKMIILDEITSMLSEQAKERVIPLIRAYCANNNIAVIWITHHMDELLATDHVWLMKDLTLVYTGFAAQLFEGNENQTLAERYELSVPWAVRKRQQLLAEGYHLPNICFSAKQLAMEVHTSGKSNFAKSSLV